MLPPIRSFSIIKNIAKTNLYATFCYFCLYLLMFFYNFYQIMLFIKKQIYLYRVIIFKQQEKKIISQEMLRIVLIFLISF